MTKLAPAYLDRQTTDDQPLAPAGNEAASLTEICPAMSDDRAHRWGLSGKARVCSYCGADRPTRRLAPARFDNPIHDEYDAEALADAIDSDGTIYPLKKAVIDEVRQLSLMSGSPLPITRVASMLSRYVTEGAKILAYENQKSGEDRRTWPNQYDAWTRQRAAELIAQAIIAELNVERREAAANAEIYRNRSVREGGTPLSSGYNVGDSVRFSARSAYGSSSAPVTERVGSIVKIRRDGVITIKSWDDEEAAYAFYDVKADQILPERLKNPLYPAIGPAAEQRSNNPADARLANPAGQTIPLKLLQPVIGGTPRNANPLASGCSQATISENIRRELHKRPDMPAAQGAAIAYSHARSQGCQIPRRDANPHGDNLLESNEILRQMGGDKRLGMWIGAHSYIGGRDQDGRPFLQFKWMATSKRRANTVRITLDPSDTYSMAFYRVSRSSYDYELVAARTDVYAEDLVRTFQDVTGLSLHL